MSYIPLGFYLYIPKRPDKASVLALVWAAYILSVCQDSMEINQLY